MRMMVSGSRALTKLTLAAAFAHMEEDDELGDAKKRDPEHTPFDSPFLNSLSRISAVSDALRSRSFMYAIKASLLGALTTLPNFLASVWDYRGTAGRAHHP